MHGESMYVGCYKDRRVHMYGESMHVGCVENQSVGHLYRDRWSYGSSGGVHSESVPGHRDEDWHNRLQIKPDGKICTLSFELEKN